jgi:signal recognition particle receptor subunit beta
MKNKVLILTDEPEIKDFLISNCNEKAIEHSFPKSVKEANSLLSSLDFPISLLSYSAISKADRNQIASLFKYTQKSKFILFDVPQDAKKRLAFYKMGTYRILDTSFKEEEVFYICNNLLKKQDRDLTRDESRFSGNLQDLSLAELINRFGKEKQSGVLKIQTPFSSGRVFFNKGHIEDASTGYRKGEEAVIYMLTWNVGRFAMRRTTVKNGKHRIKLSNIALLLMGENIRSEFYNKIKKLANLSTRVRVIHQGDLLSTIKDTAQKNFFKKLTEFKKIHDILEISPYGILDTIDHLLILKEKHYLEVEKGIEEIEDLAIEEKVEKSGLAESLLTMEDSNVLRKKLNAQELNNGKLIIIGTNTCGKTDFIRQFAQGGISGVRSNQDLDFSKVELDQDFSLLVFGISIDKRLTSIMEKLSEELVGYIFLIDAMKPDQFEFTNYILNHLTATYLVPIAIAITNIEPGDKKLFNHIKSIIHIPDKREPLICDVTKREDVKNVIMSIEQYKKSTKRGETV